MSITNLNDTTPAAPSDGTNVKWQSGAVDPVTLTRPASAYVPDATASGRGAVQLAGDLAGTAPVPTVAGLQTRPVIGTAPNDGEVLTWVAGDGKWEPKPVAIPNQPYDLVIALPGMPAANATYLIIAFDRAVNFAGNFAGSHGKALTNPAGSAVFAINKNGSQVGSITISTGGVFTFATTGGAAQAFAAGDYMTLLTPNPQDTSLADVSFTLAGIR